MKALLTAFVSLLLIVGGFSAGSAQNQYIINDAAALNELWTAVGGPTWPNQQGWPIPVGWQSGDRPATIFGVYFVDSSYSVDDGKLRRTEFWASSIGFRTATRQGSFPAAISFPKLEYFQFYADSAIGGSFPDFSGCPKLRQFVMANVKAEGSLTAIQHSSLEEFSLSGTKMKGSIESIDCPKIRYLSISNNGFRGTLPPFSAPNLEKLDIRGAGPWEKDTTKQRFSGTFPSIDAPKLKELIINGNAFSGPVPNINQWPMLQEAMLYDNMFSGPVPDVAVENLKRYSASRNPLQSALPQFTAPKLETIEMSSCSLQGAIPQWNLPALRHLSLDDNELQGAFPVMSTPKLYWLIMTANGIDHLPHLLGSYPELEGASFRENALQFDDMERNADMLAKDVWQYWDQDSIDLYREEVGDNYHFSVKARGEANTYRWFFCATLIDTAKGPALVVPKKDYHQCEVVSCVVSNPNAPELRLLTRRSPPPQTVNPLIVAGIEFFGKTSPWKGSAKKPTYTTSGEVKINDFLQFSGSIEIDTEAVAITARGRFYLIDVPLPGGRMGTFELADGSYSLKLLGDKGAITGFASSAISRLPTIGGVKIHLSSISLVGGRNAHGISISGGITVNGLSNGCHSNGPGPTVINIEGLTYSRTEGISVSGMKVENVGFTSFPRFCLKSLEASYNDKEDKLAFGATVAMPFAEVGGGVQLLGGAVDSVAWRVEATEHAIPLGQTNLGIAGFFGDISKIVKGPLNVTLGGIFTSMVPKDFVKFDLAGTYESPSTIGASIDGGAIPLPLSDDAYQLKLKGALSYDFANGLTKLSGEANIGTIDGKKYFLDGALSVDMKASSLALKGKLRGGYEIQAFEGENADAFPYDWINAKLGLPKKFTTEAQFVFIKSRLLFGTANLGPDLGVIDYVFDFNKNHTDPDFLYWRRSPGTKDLVGFDPDAPATQRSVSVPASARRLVVRIIGRPTVLASTVTEPDGTTRSSTQNASEYTATTSGTKAFWTFLKPASGQWTIDIPGIGAADDVAFFVDVAPEPLTITATQTQRSVTVRWNTTSDDQPTDSLAFFIAGTGTILDGYHLASASLQAGTATFTLPDPFPVCSFNIEAQGMRGFDLIADTASTLLTVPNGLLSPPVGIRVTHYDTWKLLQVRWTPSPSADGHVRGYALSAREPSGNERPIGEAFRWNGWAEFAYEKRPGDVLLMRSVDVSGNTGCPTVITDVSTSIVAETPSVSAPISIVPHPVTNNATIGFSSNQSGPAILSVMDLQGSTVLAHVAINVEPGITHTSIVTEGLAPGAYIVEVRIGVERLSAPMLIVR